MSNRLSIVMAAVTFGALAVSATAVVGAYLVVDGRAAQVLRGGPPAAPAEKKSPPMAHGTRTAVGNGARLTTPGAPSRTRSELTTATQTTGSATTPVTAGQSLAQQSTPGPAPDVNSDGQKKRYEARHRHSKHARRLARSWQQPQEGRVGSQQGTQERDQSAFFFPFR